MSLITKVAEIITELYPDATFTLSNKFNANTASYFLEAEKFPLIILNNEIKKNNEVKINNNVLKDTRIAVTILNLDSVDNSDLESEDIRSEMEVHADKIAAKIYQLTEVRPADRQKYKTDPEFHVLNTDLTGVTMDMNVNYNEIINF